MSDITNIYKHEFRKEESTEQIITAYSLGCGVQGFFRFQGYAILQPAGIEFVYPAINFQKANKMFAARAKKWRQDVLNEGILIGMGMTEDKAKNWRQDVLNEGIAIGERNMTAKVKEWQISVAEKMLKAGKPKAEIIQFTEITEAELDKIQIN